MIVIELPETDVALHGTPSIVAVIDTVNIVKAYPLLIFELTCTVTSPLVAPTGMVTRIAVFDHDLYETACTPLKETKLESRKSPKPTPVMVTSCPVDDSLGSICMIKSESSGVAGLSSFLQLLHASNRTKLRMKIEKCVMIAPLC